MQIAQKIKMMFMREAFYLNYSKHLLVLIVIFAKAGSMVSELRVKKLKK